MTVRLRQGGLGLPERPERDFYFRDDATTKAQRAAYVRHIGRMFELSGWKEEVARASAERVMALETSLAKASKKLVDLRDPEGNYHKVKREELPTLAPNFPWEPYFRAIGLPDFQKELVVGQPDFFRAFSEAINVFPLSDWKIYLRWHLLRSTSAYLGKDFEEERFAFFQKTLSGIKEMLPRWKRVLRALDGAVGEDLGQLYVRRAFSSEAKRRVLEMIHFHREALRASILRAPWMGEATKAQALRKLDAMRAKVGYPDVWRDYSGLQVRAQPYVLNVLAGEAFEFRRQMAKLGKPVDRNEWGMTPQTNNAYYNPTLNEIALPAGILQPPFFVEQADDASNYGALASTIGHEILHGFDDKGSQFDADGNLRNWWTPEDRQAYLAQTEKVVKQYEAYEPVPGVHVQGHQTLGENLADIGGLKISYEAWKLASAGKPAAPQGVFSPEQRFFIAFAQGWRTNERPERTRLILQSDVHSPIRWRVLGPVAALPEFQQAFGCKDGDPMAAHEERRFTIW